MEELYSTESMGETAENLATIHKIPRDEQDEYAFRSQHRAATATRAGRFAEELVPVVAAKNGHKIKLDFDEHVRMDLSIEDMKQLPPVFSKTGTVTAGNSSGITDGAAATVLVSEREAERRNLKPLARIVDYAISGVDPLTDPHLAGRRIAGPTRGRPVTSGPSRSPRHARGSRRARYG